jgi:putative spermidine/putrescine transport system substrate-binding protein
MGSFFARRWVVALVVLSGMLLGGASLTACGGDDGDEEGGDAGNANVTLTVAGWGGASNETTRDVYLDPFEAAEGAKSRFSDAPGTQLARLEAQNEAGEIEWDTFDGVPGDAAFIMDERGYLEQLPSDLEGELEDLLGAERVTPFGFAHGNIASVIVCNMDRMKVCPKDMGEFYDTEKFPQKRMFSGIAPIMAVTTAQVASGVPNTETATTELDVDAAFEQLDRLKPKIDVFWQAGDQQEQIMRSGAADMGIMWSNRAHRLVADGENLKIVWAGATYEPSYWAVPKGAPNREAAFDLMSWIASHPKAQAKWAEELGASVPHPEALDFLPDEVVRDLADQPDNFEQLAVPNFAWYAKNTKALDRRYQDFVRGG